MINASLNIAWSIAEIEASAAGFESILPNHFCFGCCKGCDLDYAKFLQEPWRSEPPRSQRSFPASRSMRRNSPGVSTRKPYTVCPRRSRKSRRSSVSSTSAQARALKRTGLSFDASKAIGQSKVSSSSSRMVFLRSETQARADSGGLSARLSRTSRKTQGERNKRQPWLAAWSKTSRDAPVAERLAAIATLLSRKIFNTPAGIVPRPPHPRRALWRFLRRNRCAALAGFDSLAAAWPGSGAVLPFPHWKGSQRRFQFRRVCSWQKDAIYRFCDDWAKSFCFDILRSRHQGTCKGLLKGHLKFPSSLTR